jgi:hypothetical protein
MKYMLTLLTGFLASSTLLGNPAGPGLPSAGTKTYHVFYVDNSRSESMASLSSDMIELLERTLDSIKGNPNAKVLFYLSNFRNPEIAKSHASAMKLVDRLNSGYSATPDSRIDKAQIRQQIFNEDLSNIGTVRLHAFLTESYTRNDLIGGAPGFLLNGLLRELAVAARVAEKDVSCSIYVPKSAMELPAALQKTLPGMVGKSTPGASRIAYTIRAL